MLPVHKLTILKSAVGNMLANALPSGARSVGTSNTLRNKLIPKKVSFAIGSESIVGHLYLPNDYDSTRRYPAIAVAGSFTSVKEQMSGTYAGELARRGIISVAIDYRNYGESDGAVRQYEDPASKAADLSAALEFLANRPDVASTGLLGICTSGGNVLYAAASDPRAKAVATVAGYFQSEAITTQMWGEEGVALRRAAGRQASELFDKEREIQHILAYGGSANESVNPGLKPYYDEPTRGRVPEWRNAFAVASWGSWIDFDPVPQASLVKVPTLVIHSEGAAFPDQARAVYERLGPNKQIIWANGTHYDFYDNDETVSFAADRLAEHFRAYLV